MGNMISACRWNFNIKLKIHNYKLETGCNSPNLPTTMTIWDSKTKTTRHRTLQRPQQEHLLLNSKHLQFFSDQDVYSSGECVQYSGSPSWLASWYPSMFYPRWWSGAPPQASGPWCLESWRWAPGKARWTALLATHQESPAARAAYPPSHWDANT